MARHPLQLRWWYRKPWLLGHEVQVVWYRLQIRRHEREAARHAATAARHAGARHEQP